VYPLCSSNVGIKTSNKPESCVDVVVARIKVGLAGAGACVGASVMGASVKPTASVNAWSRTVVAGEPQALSNIINAKNRMEIRFI
jgi:hypothetical protein